MQLFDEEYEKKLVDLVSSSLSQVTYHEFSLGLRGRSGSETRELVDRRDPTSISISPDDLPTPLMEKLIAALEPALDRVRSSKDTVCINTGYSVHHLIDASKCLTCCLLRGAKILGADRAVRLLLEWVNGGCWNGNVVALVQGITSDQEITIDEGITCSRLPFPTAKAAWMDCQLNEMGWHGSSIGMGLINLRRFSILTIPTFIQPMLYKPPDNGRRKFGDWSHLRAEARWGTSGNRGEFNWKNFCESLSVVLDQIIILHCIWSFQDEADAFFGGNLYPSRRIVLPTVTYIADVTREDLERAFFVYKQRNRKGRERLSVAISRWNRIHNIGTTKLDNFIDLRIALETLFMGGARQELGYRLASHGAWYLGKTGNERRTLFKDLKDFYNVSSAIVHTGTHKKSRKEEVEMLKRIGDICREGILKRCEEGAEPDWTNIVLGCG